MVWYEKQWCGDWAEFCVVVYHFQQYSDDLVLNGRSTDFLLSMEGFTDVASNNFQRALSGKG